MNKKLKQIKLLKARKNLMTSRRQNIRKNIKKTIKIITKIKKSENNLSNAWPCKMETRRKINLTPSLESINYLM